MFNPDKYLGLWYEIIRYPSWFEPAGSYNTTATYSLNMDGSIQVINSTITPEGENIIVNGEARLREALFNDGAVPIGSLHVSFPGFPDHSKEANYLIDNIFLNSEGEYLYAIVSNSSRDSLFVLSRVPTRDIRMETMMQLLNYLSEKYDLSKIEHVPHFML